MWRISDLHNEVNRPVNGQIMLLKIKKLWMLFFKRILYHLPQTFDSITDRIQYLLEHNYIEELSSRNFVLNLKNWPNLSKGKNFNSSPLWRPTNSITNMLWKQMMEYYLESMEGHSSSMLSLQMEMKLSREISQTKLSTNVTNKASFFLKCWSCPPWRWFYVSWSGNRWYENAIGRSALPFNFHVSVVGLISLSNLREAGAPINGQYEGALLGLFQLWNSLKVTSLTLTNWITWVGLFTSASSIQTSSPSCLPKKREMRWKDRAKTTRELSSCPVVLRSCRKNEKCTSSALTLWNHENTGTI